MDGASTLQSGNTAVPKFNTINSFICMFTCCGLPRLEKRRYLKKQKVRLQAERVSKARSAVTEVAIRRYSSKTRI